MYILISRFRKCMILNFGKKQLLKLLMMWDMIEKKFPEAGNKRTLQGSSSSASPGKEKRSAGDRKRDRK